MFESQIETAKRLIEKNGELVIWRQVRNTVNENQPWKPVAPVPVDNEVTIVFLPRERVDTQLIRATSESIPIGSVYGLMAQVDFSPSAKDVVIRGGKEIRINAIDPLAPNGTPIIYTIDFSL